MTTSVSAQVVEKPRPEMKKIVFKKPSMPEQPEQPEKVISFTEIMQTQAGVGKGS